MKDKANLKNLLRTGFERTYFHQLLNIKNELDKSTIVARAQMHY